MKCTICKNGIMKKVNDVMEQDGIEFEAYKCSSCGEEVVDMKQLEFLAEKYRKLRKAKDVTFAKWGNSIAVRIPNDIVEEYHIKSGRQAVLTAEKKGIKITPT